jgi:hypothetical protein
MSAPAYFFLPDGSKLGLNVSRFDERQRRLRLELPESASGWDYAPLIDVTRHEKGFANPSFTGQTAAEWLTELRSRQAPEYEPALRWYEAVISRASASLANRPRIPDNHYCIELAAAPLRSTLPGLIRDLRLRRAKTAQWLATLKSLTGKGVKAEELEVSGALVRLQQIPVDAVLDVEQVLRMVDMRQVMPKITHESQFGFVTTAGWNACCRRVPPSEYRRRQLIGAGRRALHIIRYRHRAFGWSIVRTRYHDMLRLPTISATSMLCSRSPPGRE